MVQWNNTKSIELADVEKERKQKGFWINVVAEHRLKFSFILGFLQG